MRDKITICNTVVDCAADLMTAKVELNRCVIDQFENLNRIEYSLTRHARIEKLTEDNKRIEAAVEVMKEFEGCWG